MKNLKIVLLFIGIIFLVGSVSAESCIVDGICYDSCQTCSLVYGVNTCYDNDGCCLLNSADLNQNGFVDLADFSIFASKWGNTGCSASEGWCSCADIDQEGIVRYVDFMIFESQYEGHLCFPGSADIDKDGAVNLNDANIFEGQYGSTDCSSPEWCSCSDLNQDTNVDLADFSIFASQYGSICFLGSADIDKDGDIDVADFNILDAQYENTDCSSPEWCSCSDLNQDFDVDLEDFSIFVGQQYEIECIEDIHCDAGETCVSGYCEAPCPDGQWLSDGNCCLDGKVWDANLGRCRASADCTPGLIDCLRGKKTIFEKLSCFGLSPCSSGEVCCTRDYGVPTSDCVLPSECISAY